MEGEIKIMVFPHNSKQYPERTEVVYSVKKISFYFLGALVLAVLGTVLIFSSSGKWNWYPALVLACASLTVTIISTVISFFEKRARKIYMVYMICHFIGGVLPLGYAFVITLILSHRFWGPVLSVLLFGLLFLLVPTLINKHARNFTKAYCENLDAGIYSPKTHIWKVSVPIIRKSREQDRKINTLSKSVVPFMYVMAVFIRGLLGKYTIYLLFLLMFLLFFFTLNEWLFYLNIYKQIKKMENQTGKEILIPHRKDNSHALMN